MIQNKTKDAHLLFKAGERLFFDDTILYAKGQNGGFATKPPVFSISVIVGIVTAL